MTQNLLSINIDEKAMPIDILNRQEIAEQILDLLITLSDAKSSCAFALNGKWGSGKTFLLNMLESKLRDYQAGERFMVFHYNCWQYDYYDEPLIAIVSAMLDNIDEYTRFLSSETKEKLKSCALSIAKETIKQVACSFVKHKIGIDANAFSDLVEKIQDSASKDSKDSKDSHNFDKYHDFHTVVEDAREDLSKLAEDQTMVIVVDELDRCLPDYAIKILERLHHLFANINNTVLIMALDKEQLKHTINTIFGAKTDCNAYLQKFIDFELKLNIGTVNDEFLEKYSEYITLFDENALEPWNGIHDYIAALFSEIEIRRQEHLMKKIHIIHKLLFSSQEKKDFSFLCFELLMVVLSEKPTEKETPPFYYAKTKSRENGSNDYVLQINDIPVLLKNYIERNWNYQIGQYHGFDGQGPHYGGTLDIPLLLIGYSELMYNGEGLLSHRKERSKYDEYVDNFKDVKRMMEMIE